MKRIKNTDGFTLVEMVVAIAVLSLFMPVMVQMMVSSVKARDNIMTTSHNNIAASAVITMLENDVEKSSALKVGPVSGGNNGINILRNDGVCVAWRSDSKGNLMRTEIAKSKLTTTWNPATAKWVTVYDKVFPQKNGSIFVLDSESMTIKYNLLLGDKSAKSTVEGNVSSKVIANGDKGYCW